MNMNRIEKSQETYKRLFGEGVPAAYATDPELQDILSRFIFGEIFNQGALDDKQRELITLVVLVTNQTLPQAQSTYSCRAKCWVDSNGDPRSNLSMRTLCGIPQNLKCHIGNE